jgi:hypothetical protein
MHRGPWALNSHTTRTTAAQQQHTHTNTPHPTAGLTGACTLSALCGTWRLTAISPRWCAAVLLACQSLAYAARRVKAGDPAQVPVSADDGGQHTHTQPNKTTTPAPQPAPPSQTTHTIPRHSCPSHYAQGTHTNHEPNNLPLHRSQPHDQLNAFSHH